MDTKLEVGSDITTTIFKIKENLLKWLELAGVDIQDPKQLLDIFIVNKILEESGSKLFSFLKERKVRTEDDLITTISMFKDPYPHEELVKSSSTLALITQYKNKKQLKATFRQPSSMSERYNRDRYRSSTPVNCYHCGNVGHIKYECRKLKYEIAISQNRYNNDSNELYRSTDSRAKDMNHIGLMIDNTVMAMIIIMKGLICDKIAHIDVASVTDLCLGNVLLDKRSINT